MSCGVWAVVLARLTSVLVTIQGDPAVSSDSKSATQWDVRYLVAEPDKVLVGELKSQPKMLCGGFVASLVGGWADLLLAYLYWQELWS